MSYHTRLEATALMGFIATLITSFLILTSDSKIQQLFANVPIIGPAAVFFVESITSTELRTTYSSARSMSSWGSEPRKVRVLIVPGHEPGYGGTDYRGVYECDLIVVLAERLAEYLRQNPRYEVTVSRTMYAWHPALAEYFVREWEAIRAFRAEQIMDTHNYRAQGSLLPLADQVVHNDTMNDVSLRLYGMNKWANEKDIDIALHLHFNDYPGHGAYSPGRYDGFALYVPHPQYSSASASRSLADAIARRLNAYHATSTMPKEAEGVIADADLIAVGSNNSVNSATVLLEYAYMYEPQFQDYDTSLLAVQDYAYQTYLGLQDFFGDTPGTYGSAALPYRWGDSPPRGRTSMDAYALQSALHYLGYYPPTGESLADCPVSGRFGPCTEHALKSFQSASNMTPTGTLTPETTALFKSLGL